MPVDRAATLRTAEKLLRQGRLDQAIAEYVRVVEDQPRDWNTANVLGDLYVRAGKPDKAIEQFVAAADSLSDEGTLAKAAALYRKILKLRPEHEHALLQCAEVAATQGVLVDARTYLRAVADRRQARGDQRGVAQITIRLASLDPNDFAARRAGARARLEVKDLTGAVRDLREIAVELMHQHRDAEAIDALREAVSLAPDDHDVRQQLLDAFLAAGDHVSAREHARTSEQLQVLAGRFEESGQHEEALALLREALAIDPGNVRLHARVNGEIETVDEEPAEIPAAPIDEHDPDRLLALANTFIRDGHVGAGLNAVRRLLRRDSNLRTDVALLGLSFTDDQPDLAFAILDLAGDAAIAEQDWAMAAAGLQELVTRVPMYLPALMRLVEVCVDGGLEATMHAAQAQLCDAYLEAGAAEEARFLAEDLVAREPWERANLERFRRALELLGEPDPEGQIAARLSGEVPFTSTDASVSAVQGESPAGEADRPTSTQPGWQIDNHNFHFEVASVDIFDGGDGEAGRADAPEDEAEVDLSVELDGLQAAPAPPAQRAAHAPDAMQPAAALEDVFARLRSTGARQMALADAQDAYTRAMSLHAAGRVDECIPLLASAAETPQLRFGTASLLGRIFREQGQLDRAVKWLERASQAPPPSPDEGRLLLYDLADVLESTGEYTRALTVCMELQADAGDYRDVSARVSRLTAIQMRG
ncbi:MAG: tetratricopeptide repeat protein [Vicinamibacterales bacterium]